MICPNCNTSLRPVDYEGIRIESCYSCRGEWLDCDELAKVIGRREEAFTNDTLRAVAESTAITGVRLTDVDRDLKCPKCGGSTTDTINYGGDTGVILDRCTTCGGYWLDAGELEQVQMIVEGWEGTLTADVEQYVSTLRDIEARWDAADNVKTSRIPVLGRLIDLCINGILDLTG